MGYSKVAIAGLGWMGVLQFVFKTFSIVKFAIIARVLTSYELGIFGITILVLGLIETFTEFGMSSFLIQHKKNIKPYIPSIFSVQVVRGTLLSFTVILLSYPISIFFHEPSTLNLMLLTAFIPLIKAFENPYVSVLQKDLSFGKDFVYRAAGYLAELILALFFVWYFRSTQGLLIALIFSTLFSVLVSWIVIQGVFKLEFRIKKIKEILAFSKWISILGIFSYITNQLDAFVIGRFMGASSLGYYQVSQKFSLNPMMDVSSTFGKVAFPIYSKFSDDKSRLKRAFLRNFIALCLLEGSFFIVCFLFPELILRILAGEKWMAMKDVFRLLALYGFLFSVWGSIGALFYSLKKQNALAFIMLVRLAVLVPSVFFGVQKAGLAGVVWALLLSLIVILPLSFLRVKKEFSNK